MPVQRVQRYFYTFTVQKHAFGAKLPLHACNGAKRCFVHVLFLYTVQKCKNDQMGGPSYFCRSSTVLGPFGTKMGFVQPQRLRRTSVNHLFSNGIPIFTVFWIHHFGCTVLFCTLAKTRCTRYSAGAGTKPCTGVPKAKMTKWPKWSYFAFVLPLQRVQRCFHTFTR